jgi:type II secretory ATPase GspE/PulE/Tfp pilus assembly ATPase PilB-like protein
VLAQRLVRTNCPECREPYRPLQAVLQRARLSGRANEIQFMRGAGCPHCRNTGLKGLTGVFEYVDTTNRLREMIISMASTNQIAGEARLNGYRTLFEAGMDKVESGAIMIEELLKETSSGEQSTVQTMAVPEVEAVHADSV